MLTTRYIVITSDMKLCTDSIEEARNFGFFEPDGKAQIVDMQKGEFQCCRTFDWYRMTDEELNGLRSCSEVAA